MSMKLVPSIKAPRVSEAEIISRWKVVTGQEARAEKTLAETRLEKGRLLVEARGMYPAKGRTDGGWSKLLGKLCVEEQTARNYMKLAGYLDSEDTPKGLGNPPPTYAKAGIVKQPRRGGAPLPYSVEVSSEDCDVDAEEEEDTFGSDSSDLNGQLAAYMIRANQAARFAFFKGHVSAEVIAMARHVADAWAKLTRELETK